jgi:hypothetical protein
LASKLLRKSYFRNESQNFSVKATNINLKLFNQNAS